MCLRLRISRKLKRFSRKSLHIVVVYSLQLLIYISKLRHNLLQVLLQIEKKEAPREREASREFTRCEFKVKFKTTFFWCFSLLLIKNNINFVCYSSDVNFSRYGLESYFFLSGEQTRARDFLISTIPLSRPIFNSPNNTLETKHTQKSGKGFAESLSRMLNLAHKKTGNI